MGIAKSVLPTYVDVAVIGAGPVGLAIAIELARLDLTTLVVDRRPPPAEDTGLRPQLLVARLGDLANLAQLGIDVRDPRIVTLLASRCEADLASVATRRDRGTYEDAHRFVIDFEGDKLAALPPETVLRGIVTAAPAGGEAGEILEQVVVHYPVTRGWRLIVQVRPRGGDPVELRAFLQHGDDTLTETWTYLLKP